MSLPPAQKDISTKPAKGSVVEPVDIKKKDKDVERKLKLYNSIQAIRASRLPSNGQLDSLLSYFQKQIDGVTTQEKNLSKDTEVLFTDITHILEAFKAEIHDKNHDELLQEFVWNTRQREHLDAAAARKDGVQVPVSKEKAKDDADQALNHIRQLINLILTNSEARKLVSDFGLVGRDLLSRSAVKAAGLVAPDQEALARVDESTRRDQFENRDEFGEIKDQATQAREKVQYANEEAKATAAETAKVTAEHARTADTRGPTTGPDGPTGVPATTNAGDEEFVEEDKKKSIFGKLSGRIPEKHKSNATEQFNKGKKFLTEDYFPKDRRDQWIWRAKKVVIECQGHDEYQTSIRWLLDFLDEYFSHGKTLAEQHSKTGTEALKSSDIDRTLSDLRTLVERFANGKSFDSLVLDRLQVMADDAKNDQELREWWSRVLHWFKNVLLEPGYILEPKCENDGRKLFDDGKRFYGSPTSSRESTPLDSTQQHVIPGTTAPVTTSTPLAPGATSTSVPTSGSVTADRGKYKAHFDSLVDGVAEFVRGIGEDSGNKRLADAVAKFTKDLIFIDSGDGEGKLTFKREMWGDIRRVVLPRLIDRVGYIPIPRIEYTDDGLDLVVENLTLSGKNLFPNIVAIEAHNYLKFSPYSAINKATNDDSRHEFIITFSQMQADMRDVAFYYSKKSGAIKLKDSGLADVVIGGEGVNVTIHLVASTNDPRSFFQVKKVNVKIDTLKFAIRDAKHDLLYKTLRPLATGLIKKQIAKAIRDGIETGLGVIDDQLIGVRDKIEQARVSRKDVIDGDAPGRLATLQEAFKRNKNAKEASIAETVSSTASQFKVVSNKRNSLLANKGHPAGWVNRAVQKEEIKADSSGSWKSDAFDIEKLVTNDNSLKHVTGNTATSTKEAHRTEDAAHKGTHGTTANPAVAHVSSTA